MKSHRTFVLSAVLVLAGVHTAFGQAEFKEVAELEAAASVEELVRIEDELERALLDVWTQKRALEERAAAGEVGRRGDEDEVRIVNGVLTWDFPTTGALLNGMTRESAGSHCTGTLIGCNTFLTANHCVERDRNPDHYYVYLQQAGIFSVEAISAEDPDYDFPEADYAVLRLGERVEGIRPTVVNSNPVPNGTRGQIVGFGRSGGFRQDYGLKRAGRVVTAECDRPETTLLCWDFSGPVGLPGEDSNTCNADSGGPLFIDTAAGPVVVGITSGGSRSSCLEGDHSYDVDARQFLTEIQAFAGDDLGAASCGDLPAVGSAEVQVFGDTRELGSSGMKDYRIELPAGLARLRLAMNGQDEFTTDFDLLVKRGAVAAPAQSDCEENGSSNYAFCEFENPAAGSWFIRVHQKGSGSGTFQVVATIIRGVS